MIKDDQMFFTKLARFIAWAMVILGSFRAATAFAIAMSGTPELARRYLGSSSTGEAIDAGLTSVFLGVCLGVATEISKALAAKADQRS